MSDRNARPVYSTGTGRTCPTCGWPADNCQCSRSHARNAAIPAKVVAKLRVEKAGRGGKTVTVIFDLPRNDAFLKELAGELKRACGSGGAVVEDTVEVQGDHRDRIATLLERDGHRVKLAGS